MFVFCYFIVLICTHGKLKFPSTVSPSPDVLQDLQRLLGLVVPYLTLQLLNVNHTFLGAVQFKWIIRIRSIPGSRPAAANAAAAAAVHGDAPGYASNAGDAPGYASNAGDAPDDDLAGDAPDDGYPGHAPDDDRSGHAPNDDLPGHASDDAAGLHAAERTADQYQQPGELGNGLPAAQPERGALVVGPPVLIHVLSQCTQLYILL